MHLSTPQKVSEEPTLTIPPVEVNSDLQKSSSFGPFVPSVPVLNANQQLADECHLTFPIHCFS